ncbi:MAG: glycosyltransferase family 4 protein [Candidatus Micrarchaeota archaeon]|nr:glycosyltransferase family 4 protein [Candidatus Micrarchaeota archaeon]
MKVAFVIPWYGEIGGGAENECRRTAENLLERGVEVEVLTTCVKDFYSDWGENYYDEGEYELNGVKIRRFKVRKRNSQIFDKLNYKLMHKERISAEEEEIYMREMINSDRLYDYIKSNGSKFDFFIFIPYMFGTTYNGMLIHPEKSILIPCLHDEAYAHLNIYRKAFEKIRGMIFYSDAERKLAERIFDLNSVKCIVMGAGVDTKVKSNPLRFLRKYKVSKPFMLYAGRKDEGKNLPTLVNFFSKYKNRNKNGLTLVLIGPGKTEISQKQKDFVLDLSFIPLQDKYDAYSAASLLCQPSLNESFSLVVMESWVCGTPVIVNEACGPTKEFCVKSNGGLWFSDYYEFEECINLILKDPKLAKKLGSNGRNYVLKNFNWDKITSDFISFLESL